MEPGCVREGGSGEDFTVAEPSTDKLLSAKSSVLFFSLAPCRIAASRSPRPPANGLGRPGGRPDTAGFGDSVVGGGSAKLARELTRELNRERDPFFLASPGTKLILLLDNSDIIDFLR